MMENDLEKMAMAHRYLYYVKNTPVISDREYDLLELGALEKCSEDSPLRSAGSDMESSYSDEVKKMASDLIGV